MKVSYKVPIDIRSTQFSGFLEALLRSRNVAGQPTSFLRDGAYATDPVIADSLATYTPGVSERRGGTTRYTHSGLKNTGAQSTNAIVATRVYDAYGAVRSFTGTWSGPFGNGGDYGYQQDDETGLRLLGHRYYDASTGRFLTRDPIKDGRNWYSYCDGDPINGVDPTGLKPGDQYKTRDAAARAALEEINGKSKREGREYAGRIYQNANGSWSYTEPNAGDEASSPPGEYPDGVPTKRKGGSYHTHGSASNGKYDDENFSSADRRIADSEQRPAYLATPGGRIKRYDPDPKHKGKGKVVIIKSPKPKANLKGGKKK